MAFTALFLCLTVIWNQFAVLEWTCLCCQWNTWYLRSGQLTSAVEDYLLWHWFGTVCKTSHLTWLTHWQSLH